MGWDYRRNVTAILAAWALQKVLGNYCDSIASVQSDMVEMRMVDQNMMTLMPKKIKSADMQWFLVWVLEDVNQTSDRTYGKEKHNIC